MTKRRLVIAIALFTVAFAAVVATARADEMRMTNDTTARFLALGVSKSTVIDFGTDLKEVLVADPTIVKAVALTTRRIHVIGAFVGQTNVFFYDTVGRQVGALNVAVLTRPPEGGNYATIDVTVYRAGGPEIFRITGDPDGFVTYSCGDWPHRCVDPTKPYANLPPGTQSVNIIGGGIGAATVPVGSGR